MGSVPRAPELQTFYEGWANYQRLVLAAIQDLTPEQLALRTAPHQWAVWQLAGHMAGARTYWFHDVLGEGDAATRDTFASRARPFPTCRWRMRDGRMTRITRATRPRSSRHST
jgi:uncharacterized damage-inducible protein DinB